MRSFHRRESSYAIEMELRLRWLEFSMLPQASRDHINSLRLVPVEETQALLDKVYSGELLMEDNNGEES